MKDKLAIMLLMALSFLSVLTIGVSIDFSGLEALQQLFFAFMAIGLPIGLVSIVLVIVDRYTDGAIRKLFGTIF